MPDCTCGASGGMDGHALDCALRGPFIERTEALPEIPFFEGDDSDDPDPIVCTTCGSEGPHTLLGTLGRTTWARCRGCGADMEVRTDG